MKTKLSLVVFALVLSQVAFSQFNFGVKAGANVTKLDGYSFKDKFEYGYHVGGFIQIGIGNKFSIQPEVLFNQYSTTVDSNYKNIYQDVFSSDQRKVKLNYLSIPLLLNYKLLGNFLSLQAGPQFSVLMDQSKTFLQNGGQAFANGDFSMVGGVQLKISAIRVTGRYVIGLKNINDIDNKDRWKNQGFQVSLGLGI